MRFVLLLDPLLLLSSILCLCVLGLAPHAFHLGAPRHVCVKRELTNLVIKLTKTRLLSVFGSSGHYDRFDLVRPGVVVTVIGFIISLFVYLCF